MSDTGAMRLHRAAVKLYQNEKFATVTARRVLVVDDPSGCRLRARSASFGRSPLRLSKTHNMHGSKNAGKGCPEVFKWSYATRALHSTKSPLT